MSTPTELRDAGMAQVTDHSPLVTVAQVDRVIRRLNKSGRAWSANDLRDKLPACRPQLIGARVNAARLRKEMRAVGEVQSNLPSTHAKKIAVWRGVS